jgi:hypothetical protein
MATQVNLNQIPGKTIDAVFPWSSASELCITFTDNTFMLIGIDREGPTLTGVKLELDRHGNAAVAAGLFTPQERDAAIAARDQDAEDLIEAREYAYYLTLKAKYEP